MDALVVDRTWTCMDCGALQATSGNCASCGKGPLVDSRDPQVKAGLLEADEQRAVKHGQRLNLVAIGIALPLVAALCALVPAFFLLGMSFFLLGFIAEVLGVALAVRFALGRAWRPRRMFPDAAV